MMGIMIANCCEGNWPHPRDCNKGTRAQIASMKHVTKFFQVVNVLTK